MLTILLIAMILIAFVAMTINKISQDVALPLVAMLAVALSGVPDGEMALQGAFKEFSRILLLFTAVAIPAHQLQRAKILHWCGMVLGEWIGRAMRHLNLQACWAVPPATIFLTWTMAASCHNTTSIVTCAPITIVICRAYGLPVLPALSGALVASNLGGFSTRWGDTPNLTEAAVWGLKQSDFFREVLPINLLVLALVTLVVILWMKIRMKRASTKSRLQVSLAAIEFERARLDVAIDRRLSLIGLLGLGGTILGPLFAPKYEFPICAAVIALCVIADRPEHRRESLTALGLETYSTLAAVFVLAHCLTGSHVGVGEFIKSWLQNSGMSIWSIAVASYFGTLFTEAASWASAASTIVHTGAPTHVAAWALGGGICAGSSSLVTAATAGILLTRETKHLPISERITFGSYVCFGLATSIGMLGFYVGALSLLMR